MTRDGWHMCATRPWATWDGGGGRKFQSEFPNPGTQEHRDKGKPWGPRTQGAHEPRGTRNPGTQGGPRNPGTQEPRENKNPTLGLRNTNTQDLKLKQDQKVRGSTESQTSFWLNGLRRKSILKIDTENIFSGNWEDLIVSET